MKVLGIHGSPRKGGNTDILLEKALEGASAQGACTEKVVLEDLDISPCREREYDAVNEKGFSVIEDDMRHIYDKTGETDVLIIAAPIFFGSLSAQTKMMIDRFQCVWLAKHVFKRDLYPGRIRGGFICASGTTREDFFKNAGSIIRHFFATINADYKAELFCGGLEQKGDVKKHPEFLERAYELGENLVIN